jgi:hypothetical protein
MKGFIVVASWKQYVTRGTEIVRQTMTAAFVLALLTLIQSRTDAEYSSFWADANGGGCE